MQPVHLAEGCQLLPAVTSKPTATLFSAHPSPHRECATFANAGVQQVRFLHNTQPVSELTSEN